eukprot:CAMPEP_0118917730 /NCGR_PEP_ID=MMETSP1166-20130328/17502_1 /TAXON_ID=1104430 /ORGANISM="Chrysoreinhardia sp, Strain CCMP3193" /LENGTH=51 /DNA_ID=CAMNT_0006857949 /DNA_START=370 /DNA_END=521 /DNA_ORIENTATION=+
MAANVESSPSTTKRQFGPAWRKDGSSFGTPSSKAPTPAGETTAPPKKPTAG